MLILDSDCNTGFELQKESEGFFWFVESDMCNCQMSRYIVLLCIMDYVVYDLFFLVFWHSIGPIVSFYRE